MGLTGTNLDRYEVHEELGRGGMSVVYRGMDTTLQRRVAIKVLHDHLTEDQQARIASTVKPLPSPNYNIRTSLRSSTFQPEPRVRRI